MWERDYLQNIIELSRLNLKPIVLFATTSLSLLFYMDVWTLGLLLSMISQQCLGLSHLRIANGRLFWQISLIETSRMLYLRRAKHVSWWNIIRLPSSSLDFSLLIKAHELGLTLLVVCVHLLSMRHCLW